MTVSLSAFYGKLNGIEPGLSHALVGQTATPMADIVRQLGAEAEAWVAGYRVKIVDGLWLAATEHRFQALRDEAAAPPSGKSLVVLQPQLHLATDVFPCEDGHAQERALLGEVLQSVEADDLWVGNRNLCTLGFLFGLHQRQASFVIRQHGNLPYQARAELQEVGRTECGVVWEHPIILQQEGRSMTLRRIVMRLDQPIRDGDTEVAMLTPLAQETAGALEVAQMYRRRWTIEGFFQSVTLNFEGEIRTLAYPKAALFCFAMSLVAANNLAVVRAALGSVHGFGKIEAGLSDFYLVDEIQHVYRGMMIAIEPKQWVVFETLSSTQLAEVLQQLASPVHLASVQKTPRGSKKKKPPRKPNPKKPHVSTAKLLKQPPLPP